MTEETPASTEGQDIEEQPIRKSPRELLKETKPVRLDPPYVVPDSVKQLEGINAETISSMECFGVNAADALNRYSCTLEDIINELATVVHSYKEQLRDLDIQCRSAELELLILQRKQDAIMDLANRKQLDTLAELLNPSQQ